MFYLHLNRSVLSNSLLKFSQDLDLRDKSFTSKEAQNFKEIKLHGLSLRKNNCCGTLNELRKEDSTPCGYLCGSKKEYFDLKQNPSIEYIPSFSESFNHKDISGLSLDQKKFIDGPNNGYYSLSTFKQTNKRIILLEISDHEQSFRNLASVLDLVFQEPKKKVILFLKDSLTLKEIESKLLNSLNKQIKEKIMDRFRALFII